jgi:hypothetical protein
MSLQAVLFVRSVEEFNLTHYITTVLVYSILCSHRHLLPGSIDHPYYDACFISSKYDHPNFLPQVIQSIKPVYPFL